MPYSSGTFSLFTPGNPVVTGTTIASTWANNTLNDIATALSTCVLKDGTQTMTANIPMGGFKLTGLAAATANGDAVRYQQTLAGLATTKGDIVAATAANAVARLAAGTNGTALLADSSQTSGLLYALSGAQPLTATAGTNTITATASPIPSAYASGQSFYFIPAATNTGATTLNVSGLGAKNVFAYGAACAGGEIVSGVPAMVFYDGTQFNLIAPVGGRLTNSLAGDVNLTNVGTYFDGPSVAQGSVGIWFASGTVTVIDTNGGGGAIHAKLYDGTTTKDAGVGTAFTLTSITLSGFFSSPAGNIRIACKNVTNAANTAIKFNQTGLSLDSTLNVVRVG